MAGTSEQLTVMMCAMNSDQLHVLITDSSNKQLLQNYMSNGAQKVELDQLSQHILKSSRLLSDLILHPVSCAFVLRLCLGVSDFMKRSLANEIYKQLTSIKVDIESLPEGLSKWIERHQSPDSRDWTVQRDTIIPIIKFKIRSTLPWVTDDMIRRGLKIKETQAFIRSSPTHLAGVETRHLLDKIEALRTLAVKAAGGSTGSDACEQMLYEMDVCMKGAAEGMSNHLLKKYVSMCVPETLVQAISTSPPVQAESSAPVSAQGAQMSSLIGLLQKTLQSSGGTNSATLTPLLKQLVPLLQAHNTPQNNSIMQQISALQENVKVSEQPAILRLASALHNADKTLLSPGDTSKHTSPLKFKKKCDRCARMGRTCYACENNEEDRGRDSKRRSSKEKTRSRSRSRSRRSTSHSKDKDRSSRRSNERDTSRRSNERDTSRRSNERERESKGSHKQTKRTESKKRTEDAPSSDKSGIEGVSTSRDVTASSFVFRVNNTPSSEPPVTPQKVSTPTPRPGNIIAPTPEKIIALTPEKMVAPTPRIEKSFNPAEPVHPSESTSNKPEVDADVDRTIKTLTTMVDALGDSDLVRFLASSKTLTDSCILGIEGMRKLNHSTLGKLYQRCLSDYCKLYRDMMNNSNCAPFAVKLWESLDPERQSTLLMSLREGADKQPEKGGQVKEREINSRETVKETDRRSHERQVNDGANSKESEEELEDDVRIPIGMITGSAFPNQTLVNAGKGNGVAMTVSEDALIEDMARKAEESVNLPSIITWISQCSALSRTKFTNTICSSVTWHLQKEIPSPRWQLFGESEPLCLILGEVSKGCYPECRECVGQLFSNLSDKPDKLDAFLLFVNAAAGLRLTITCLHYGSKDKCALQIAASLLNNFGSVLDSGETGYNAMQAVLDKVCVSDIASLQRVMVEFGIFKMLANPDYRIVCEAVFKTGSNSQQLTLVHGIFIDLDDRRFCQLIESGFHRSSLFASFVNVGSGPNIVRGLVDHCIYNDGFLFALLLSDPVTNQLAMVLFERANYYEKCKLQECVLDKMDNLFRQASSNCLSDLEMKLTYPALHLVSSWNRQSQGQLSGFRQPPPRY